MTPPLQHILTSHFTPQQLASALDHLPLAISFTRLDTQTIFYRNRTFKQLFGYEPDEFKTIYDWFDAALPFPEDVALTLERWAPFVTPQAAPDDTVGPIEVRVLCKDGTIKNVLHSGIVMPQANCVVATFADLSNTRRDRPSPMVNLQAAQAVQAAAHLLPELAAPFATPTPWEALFTERRRQSDTLRRMAELLDRTGRLAGVGGWEVDLLNDTVTWTEETHRIHAVPPGYQPTLATGVAFYTPEARDLIRNVLDEAINTGKPWDVEANIIRADGQLIWVRTRGFVEFAEGKPVRLFGAIQDITDRILRQNDLRQANERLVLATTSGQIGIFDWDILHDKAVWDDRMYRLYGLDPERMDASLETWLRRLHPEETDRPYRVVMAAVTSGEPYNDEFRILWPDGSLHYVRATGQATQNADGVPARFTGVTWDVTEPRRLARERADQDELFRTTLQSIGDGVITTDAQTRVRWMNPVAERLTGWTVAEAGGLPLSAIFQLIQEDTRQPIQHPLAQCIASGQPITFIRDTVLIARHGAEVGIDKCASPIRDVTGNILGVVLVFHDVTEQRRLARDAQRILQADIQMKDEFLSHVSHELRSPLASIYSFAGILADGIAGRITQEQKEYLDIILRNSRQLRSMIDDLLQVTRSETGKLSIVLEPTSLSEAITDAIHTLQGHASAKKISLTAASPRNLPLALADATRLRQILIILLDNATKFTPPGGAIHIAAARSRSSRNLLEVCVADTGCGIEKAVSQRIFEHLYQVDEPGREGRNGLGLGLFIARDLVIRHNGIIWVDSKVGKGSQFHFTIPIAPDASATTPNRRRAADRRRSTTTR